MLEMMERVDPPGSSEASEQPAAAPDRAAGSYAEPQLIIYGSLRAITARVGSKGMRDGSGSRKTGF
jgi:hypothetical protein